jgi:hypothetical protein
MQIVNSLEEARAALRGASAPLLLASPPFAACHAGVHYYVAMEEALRREFPDAAFRLLLCCGDDPARAFEALQLGFRDLRCAVTDGRREALRQAAVACGATLWE